MSVCLCVCVCVCVCVCIRVCMVYLVQVIPHVEAILSRQAGYDLGQTGHCCSLAVDHSQMEAPVTHTHNHSASTLDRFHCNTSSLFTHRQRDRERERECVCEGPTCLRPRPGWSVGGAVGPAGSRCHH